MTDMIPHHHNHKPDKRMAGPHQMTRGPTCFRCGYNIDRTENYCRETLGHGRNGDWYNFWHVVCCNKRWRWDAKGGYYDYHNHIPIQRGRT